MPELIKAKEPFRFYTRLHLLELTGLRAATLSQLLAIIKKVPEASIYYHTHGFLQQHQYLSPEPANDFAYWVAEVLGEDELGEKLAAINTIQFADISGLRKRIIAVVENYLKEHPLAKMRFASEGSEFHFVKSTSFVIFTGYIANDLNEFVDILKKVTLDCIYFHVFEARLRIGRKANDFAHWFETSIGDSELAQMISRFDPYIYTLEDLRKIFIRIIETRLK